MQHISINRNYSVHFILNMKFMEWTKKGFKNIAIHKAKKKYSNNESDNKNKSATNSWKRKQILMKNTSANNVTSQWLNVRKTTKCQTSLNEHLDGRFQPSPAAPSSAKWCSHKTCSSRCTEKQENWTPRSQ